MSAYPQVMIGKSAAKSIRMHQSFAQSMNQPDSSSTVTIRDVARAAGVHVSTVSRALNPDKRSADQRRGADAWWKRRAQRLGYRPNRAASALRTGRTHTIGVLVPDITNAVFPPILPGHRGQRGGARLLRLRAPTWSTLRWRGRCVERMRAQRVDGLVLAIATRDDPLVDFVVKAGLTAVLVNRADETGRLPAVVSDDRLAMKLAVDHLRRPGPSSASRIWRGRRTFPPAWAGSLGVEQALRDHRGMKLCRGSSARATAARPAAAAMKQLLGGRRRAAGRWCAATTSSRWAPTTCCARRGLRVPQDISVTGHNDMPLVDMVNPPLTTIRLPHRELGWRAAEMLFAEIDGPAMSASTVVPRPELVVRSRPPRRPRADACCAWSTAMDREPLAPRFMLKPAPTSLCSHATRTVIMM